MAPTEQDNEMMREAIKVMREAGCIKKTGGPFGCVIAKDGKIIAAGGNSVVADNDPSAHAEVNTIRKACKALGTWDLSGCKYQHYAITYLHYCVVFSSLLSLHIFLLSIISTFHTLNVKVSCTPRVNVAPCATAHPSGLVLTRFIMPHHGVIMMTSTPTLQSIWI